MNPFVFPNIAQNQNIPNNQQTGNPTNNIPQKTENSNNQNSASTKDQQKLIYQVQINKMKEMGFLNDDANLDALLKNNGNVEAAVEYLISLLS